ncbi:hypothetical protein IBX65_08795 [Candidatus Aerophobetes bacterium]|nr:hypothetical protein [Candidatus Aerophobetes bacterium]
MNPEVRNKLLKEREQILSEFEELLKDFREVKIHLKKRPDDYNEPHYLIYEEEELYPVAEMYARIGPGDDGDIQIYMMGSPLEQRIVRFIDDNVSDKESKSKIISCVKKSIPSPPEEDKIKKYLEKEAEKFKHIKLKVYE